MSFFVLPMNFMESLIEPTRLAQIVFVLSSVLTLLLLGFLWLLFKVISIRRRQDSLFAGKPVDSVENILLRHTEELATLDTEIQELFEISNQLHQLGQKSLYRVGFVRFNPFKEVGGNQSFSIALLDGKNNGVVISALHTRDASRVYAKPIEANQSPTPLTEEEKKALSIANEQAITIRPAA